MTQTVSQQYTSECPADLYRAAGVRELDRVAIQEQGIPGFELMCRAGTAAFALLQERWPTVRRLVLMCGIGNNGGDGYVIAALAQQAGLQPLVLQVGDANRIQGDALLALQWAQSKGVAIRPFPGAIPTADLIVDALLGTGLSGPVRPDYVAAIDAINCSGLPVLAADIPSGLCADTGSVLGSAVRADATITFIGMKQGLLTGQAPDHVGALFFAGLDVPPAVYGAVAPAATSVTPAYIKEWLPPRSRLAHKGSNGHVLVIGGDHGMGGAVAMAAEAAGRVGAGLVSVVTRPEHVAPILTRRPECMVTANTDLQPLLHKATVIVIGPGLGQSEWGQALLRQSLASPLPLVLDADALNLLSKWHEQNDPLTRRGNWVITPHPGEAARLLRAKGANLRENTTELQRNRFDTVLALQQQYAAVAVLKGAGSLIAGSDGRIWLSRTGNPGMASGGMGDVLSGVIGALIAQGLTLEQAAAAGVWMHGAAADKAAAQGGERGMLATDLMPWLRQLANGSR
ncbi:MAG TPA: NAD(P)H-hydrate dehydratase [Dongiaceae bacterium]|nr:NAD(P)H-hydrate dehydratase [Dongiaceae bacterium]